MLEILKSALFIVEIVLGLGLVIFLHESGHFLMAKKNKVRVEIFSLGFGPAIWRRKWGDTEYRISWIPLGGYVKMAGESIGEERTGKPDELTSKTAWQRFQIFVAGAIMNLIIAFPIAIAAFWAGRYEMSPEIGVPGVPETYAGMRPGDVILEVDGEPIQSGDEYRIEMVRQPKGRKVPVKIRRGDQEKMLEVEQRGSEGHRTLPCSTKLGTVTPGSPLASAGLRQADEITTIDGVPVFSSRQVMELLQDRPGKDLEFVFRRRHEEGATYETLKATVHIPPRTVKRFPDEFRLIQPIVGKVEKGRPAFGKFEKDDVIKRIGTRTIKSWQDLMDEVEPALGKTLEVEFLRRQDSKTVEVEPTWSDRGKGLLGLGWNDTNIIADAPEGSFFHKQNLRAGDEIISIEGLGGKITIRQISVASIPEGQTALHVKIRRSGVAEPIDVVLTPPEKEECDYKALGLEYHKGDAVWDFARVFHRRGFAAGLREGLYEPYNIGKLTLQLLYKLVAAEEPASGLAGPVGIFQVSYRSAELSTGNFLWLLCLITVNLGIFNLLPIPILDGGHVVLLAIEKFRGKPPSEKFIAIFQYAGLVFLLALIIFVTYNDFSRIFTGG